ncbi:MAG: hypothetical protein IPH73_03220 [Rhodocyclales bacterium]|nr:hypothetical protein [Rhodocyclales bacterium]
MNQIIVRTRLPDPAEPLVLLAITCSLECRLPDMTDTLQAMCLPPRKFLTYCNKREIGFLAGFSPAAECQRWTTSGTPLETNGDLQPLPAAGLAGPPMGLKP